MRHLRKLAVTAGAVAALAAAPPALGATEPAAGSFVEGPETITSERQSGGNFIIELTRPVEIDGTYSGGGQAVERLVIHADGSTNVHITIAFAGLACGQPAELEFLFVGQGQLDETLESGTIAGHYTVVDGGQSASRRLRGHGDITGQAGVGGTYEGKAHCG
jgi:hypothetical protein